MAQSKLDNIKDELSKGAFNMTKAEAHSKGICINCKEPAFSKCYSDTGRSEYGISGMCEQCFDKMFAEPEGDDDQLEEEIAEVDPDEETDDSEETDDGK